MAVIKPIKIANRLVGYGQPVFIIAEAGVNHNGQLDTALKLVDAAKQAGADAIKFQTFKAEEVCVEAGEMAEYQKKNIGQESSQLAMLKKLELQESFYQPIIDYCKKQDIIFFSTPHGGFSSVDFLQTLDVPAFKFGSGDLTNLPILEHAARFGKPMILGTGMATMSEVKEAIDAIKKIGNEQIVVLHCTTNYPSAPEEINLLAMKTMMDELDVLVGYSDHSLGGQVPLMSVVLGACVFEKHFTLDRQMTGPDHLASVEPNELKEMISQIRKVPIILGSGIKQPHDHEQQYIPLVRKSIVSASAIKAGEIFNTNNLSIKRPGNGLIPAYWSKIIGHRARVDIMPGALIKESDII